MLSFCANLSLLFQDRPLLDRFQAARDAGFDAVELQFPYGESAERLARARAEAGVEVVLINAPLIGEGHGAGGACRPELTTAFGVCLSQARDYAQALGVGRVNVLAGCCPDPTERNLCRETLCANLQLAVERLAPIGAEILLEAINGIDVPGFLVDSLDEAERLIARCAGRVGLQFDLYHVAMMGLDPARALPKVLDLVRHVQFADAPGRHEPGTGATAFFATLDQLDQANFPGWVGAEYRPKTTTLDSLGWLPAWRERYGATARLEPRSRVASTARIPCALGSGARNDRL